MTASGSIRIKGLNELQAALRAMGGAVEAKLDAVLADAADLVASGARRKIPTVSGAARASVKVAGGQITAGGRRAPYLGWLDFGGRVGPKRSVDRPYRRRGRYIYATFIAEEAAILGMLEDALTDLARDAGLEVG